MAEGLFRVTSVLPLRSTRFASTLGKSSAFNQTQHFVRDQYSCRVSFCWRTSHYLLIGYAPWTHTMAEPDFRRPGTHPSGSFRPANTTAPDTDDVVYIETVMAQAQSHLTGHDGAGVLRRNQACLACRRRKLVCCFFFPLLDIHASSSLGKPVVVPVLADALTLTAGVLVADYLQKCDAQRPHCSTCVRSYNHILKTSPRNNPVLTCDYDDSEDQELALAASEAGEEEDGAKKKKRKATGEGRKKKIADEETEAERLRKKIGKSFQGECG